MDENMRKREEPIQIGRGPDAVRVSKVYTRNGERLEIESRELGRAIRLDAIELESLTWQGPETFSELRAGKPALADDN